VPRALILARIGLVNRKPLGSGSASILNDQQENVYLWTNASKPSYYRAGCSRFLPSPARLQIPLQKVSGYEF